MLPLAAYDLGDLLWSMLVFFAWIIFFWLLFIVFGDLFRRHDISGWGKAGWTIFVILVPYLGVLIYLIANGGGMAERSAKDVQDAQAQTDAYIKSVAGGSADQIAKAKELLDSGAITQAEYDELKAKALAS